MQAPPPSVPFVEYVLKAIEHPPFMFVSKLAACCTMLFLTRSDPELLRTLCFKWAIRFQLDRKKLISIIRSRSKVCKSAEHTVSDEIRSETVNQNDEDNKASPSSTTNCSCSSSSSDADADDVNEEKRKEISDCANGQQSGGPHGEPVAQGNSEDANEQQGHHIKNNKNGRLRNDPRPHRREYTGSLRLCNPDEAVEHFLKILNSLVPMYFSWNWHRTDYVIQINKEYEAYVRENILPICIATSAEDGLDDEDETPWLLSPEEYLSSNALGVTNFYSPVARKPQRTFPPLSPYLAQAQQDEQQPQQGVTPVIQITNNDGHAIATTVPLDISLDSNSASLDSLTRSPSGQPTAAAPTIETQTRREGGDSHATHYKDTDATSSVVGLPKFASNEGVTTMSSTTHTNNSPAGARRGGGPPRDPTEQTAPPSPQASLDTHQERLVALFPATTGATAGAVEPPRPPLLSAKGGYRTSPPAPLPFGDDLKRVADGAIRIPPFFAAVAAPVSSSSMNNNSSSSAGGGHSLLFLTLANFREALQQNTKGLVVVFHAKYSAKSNEALDVFQQIVQTQLLDPMPDVAVIYTVAEPELASLYNVSWFPTVVYIPPPSMGDSPGEDANTLFFSVKSRSSSQRQPHHHHHHGTVASATHRGPLRSIPTTRQMNTNLTVASMGCLSPPLPATSTNLSTSSNGSAASPGTPSAPPGPSPTQMLYGFTVEKERPSPSPVFGKVSPTARGSGHGYSPTSSTTTHASGSGQQGAAPATAAATLSEAPAVTAAEAAAAAAAVFTWKASSTSLSVQQSHSHGNVHGHESSVSTSAAAEVSPMSVDAARMSLPDLGDGSNGGYAFRHSPSCSSLSMMADTAAEELREMVEGDDHKVFPINGVVSVPSLVEWVASRGEATPRVKTMKDFVTRVSALRAEHKYKKFRELHSAVVMLRRLQSGGLDGDSRRNNRTSTGAIDGRARRGLAGRSTASAAAAATGGDCGCRASATATAVASGAAAPTAEAPLFIFLGGGMAAGKSTAAMALAHSTWWRNHKDHSVLVNADEFKVTEPVFDGIQAEVHTKSTRAAESLLVQAINQGRSIVFDGTMMWVPFVLQVIDMVRNAHISLYKQGPGYNGPSKPEEYFRPSGPRPAQLPKPYVIRFIGITVEPEIAVPRGFLRKFSTGRGVPITTQLRSFKCFAENFPLYAALVDSATLYDNNIFVDLNKGELPPVMAERSLDSPDSALTVYDEAAYRLFIKQTTLNEDADNILELYPTSSPALGSPPHVGGTPITAEPAAPPRV